MLLAAVINDIVIGEIVLGVITTVSVDVEHELTVNIKYAVTAK